MKEVLDYLERHWRRHPTVNELAASVNLGPSRLAHLVRMNTQTSIRELVRRRRITEAANLLLTTHQRISEIGYAVGFTDMANFNHAFRRELGISPRAYRQRELGNRMSAEDGEEQDFNRSR